MYKDHLQLLVDAERGKEETRAPLDPHHDYDHDHHLQTAASWNRKGRSVLTDDGVVVVVVGVVEMGGGGVKLGLDVILFCIFI